jgi:Ala-tRNA(Pro) deacylase
MGESNFREFLSQNNIELPYFEHDAFMTVADSKIWASKHPGANTKNLFLRDKKGQQHLLVIVPAYLSVDLEKLSDLLGVHKLGFASAQRLMDYLGVQPGSVSVFGLINDRRRSVRCVIDQSLWDAEAIHAHPLINTATMIVSHSDLNKFLALTGHSPQIIRVPALGPQAIAA